MTSASNPPVRRTATGDPVPFAVQALKLPEGWRLEPRQGGALERVARTHGVSQAAMQELLNMHFEHTKALADDDERRRYDFYREEHRRFSATAGSADKLAAAKGLLAAYKRAQGTDAHGAVMAALERDAGHHAAVLNFLAWAANHGGHGNAGLTKGQKRYGVRAGVARVVETLSSLIRPWFNPAPSYAREIEAND